MYRLIPFRNFKELNYTGSLYSLYEDCLNSGSVLMQDSKDMVVEKFTLEKLHELEFCNSKVFYQGFSTTEYCDEDELFSIDNEYLDIQGKNKFLNDTLEVICDVHSDNSWLYDIFNSILDEEPYVNVQEMFISFNSNSFKLSMSSYFCESSESSLVLLSINDEPLMFLDGDMLLSEDVSFEIYFELVQICKTKTGFDIVIYFPEVQGYFGIRLSKDLKLVEFSNIDVFVDQDLTKRTDWESFKVQLAKGKLTGNMKNALMEVFSCLE